MIAPRGDWQRFENDKAKSEFMIKCGLTSARKAAGELIYTGHFVDEPTPCALVGHIGDHTAVIKIDDELHCIHTDELAEMQVGFRAFARPDVFVVLDLETTGRSCRNDEIIEIAAVKYIHGEESEIFETLVNPGFEISTMITGITGIENADLEQAPTISEVLPDLITFLGDAPVVGHNINSFDKKFLQAAYSKAGEEFKNKTIDTLSLARKAMPELPHHTLEDLKRELNIEVDVSHRALPDVYTTAEVYRICGVKMLKKRNADPLPEPKPKADTLADSKPKRNKIKVSDIHQTVECIDTSSPLYGKNIVFTGELSITREEAMTIAVNCGATVKSAVSKRTDYLVVGEQDTRLVGDDGMSGKEEKTYALNASGEGHIKILSEADFIALAENKEPSEQNDSISPEEAAPFRIAFLDAINQIIAENWLEGLKASENELKVPGSARKWSFSFQSSVVAYLYYGKVAKYIEIFAGEDAGKKIYLDKGQEAAEWLPSLRKAAQAAIEQIPKDFSCCSHYAECSDAMRCVHPDKDFALGCFYRKQMARGKVFYGENRNID